jgi:hypothetical protein
MTDTRISEVRFINQTTLTKSVCSGFKLITTPSLGKHEAFLNIDIRYSRVKNGILPRIRTLGK